MKHTKQGIDRLHQHMSPLVIYVVLATITLLILSHMSHYLDGAFPLGDDSSTHIISTQLMAEYLKDCDPGLWFPSFNGGCPLITYYQPLSQVVTALTALVMGGPEHAVVAYKFWILLVLAIQPWVFYFAMRRLDFDHITALVAGLLVGTLLTNHGNRFGFGIYAYLKMGLYAQLFASILLPLAFAETARYLHGRGGVGWAALTLGLLYLSHTFVGTAMIAVLLLGALMSKKREVILVRLRRLVPMGLLVVLLTAFWVLPMILTLDYMGGWPFESVTSRDGWGVKQIWQSLYTGAFADWNRFPIRTGQMTLQVPLMSIYALIGILFVCRRDYREQNVRLILGATLLTGYFLAGRRSFGPLVEISFLPNAQLPLERYCFVFSFFLALLAVIGVRGLVRKLQSSLKLNSLVALLTACFLGGLSFVPWYIQCREALEVKSMNSDFVTLLTTLREESLPGRYYSNTQLGIRTHWDLYLPTLYAKKPGGINLAHGHHDSLSYFYFSYYNPCHALAQETSELLNVRYLIKRSYPPLKYLETVKVHEGEDYQLHRIEGSYGYFEFIDPPRILQGTHARGARPLMRRWMEFEHPHGESFIRFQTPIKMGLSFDSDNSMLGLSERPRSDYRIVEPNRSRPQAHTKDILEKHNSSNRYGTVVELKGGGSWLLLKASAHPFWRAFIDKEKTDIYQVSPAFMGIWVPEGRHLIDFQYRHPRFQWVLLGIAILTALFCLGWETFLTHKLAPVLPKFCKRNHTRQKQVSS